MLPTQPLGTTTKRYLFNLGRFYFSPRWNLTKPTNPPECQGRVGCSPNVRVPHAIYGLFNLGILVDFFTHKFPRDFSGFPMTSDGPTLGVPTSLGSPGPTPSSKCCFEGRRVPPGHQTAQFFWSALRLSGGLAYMYEYIYIYVGVTLNITFRKGYRKFHTLKFIIWRWCIVTQDKGDINRQKTYVCVSNSFKL